MTTVGFEYPASPHVRRHGPQGYETYRSFRPWLRDEFCFRCVYCLIREQWGRTIGEFDLDHFLPQARNLEQALDYDNLLYSCASCNVSKGDQIVPDPEVVLTRDEVVVHEDGSIEPLTVNATRLIRMLDLDGDQYRRWRRVWIRIIRLAAEYDQQVFEQMMGFPNKLPDLAHLNPPRGNSREDGIRNSYFVQRATGRLADTY